jgi:hypothetical protein
MRRLSIPSALVLLGSLFASVIGCSAPSGDGRLARQAALGMTIQHQVLRFADQLLYDAIDCTATPEENAAAIATLTATDLGTCAEVMQTGPELDVMTGASCGFGEAVYASLATHVAISRDGEDLVLALELSRARINGLDTDGTLTLRSADCRTFRASMDIESVEYTIATPAGEELVLVADPGQSTLTGPLDVVALNASAAERELAIENDAMVFGAGQCWPEGGGIRGMRGASMVTITFDAATTTIGDAHVSPAIDGTTAYSLPQYGPCPDTDPRP